MSKKIENYIESINFQEEDATLSAEDLQKKIERRCSREAIQISKQMERNGNDLKYQCEEEKRNCERLEVNFFLSKFFHFGYLIYRKWLKKLRTKLVCTRE